MHLPLGSILLFTMRMIFYADASPQIGAGHVMRVTTIAQAALKMGYECHFVGDIQSLTWVKEYITSLGFKSVSGSLDRISLSWHDSILVFDSYTLSSSSGCLRPSEWALTVNVCDRYTPKYPADLYILQDLSPTVDSKHPNVFSGPDFTLLREEIVKCSISRDYGTPLKVVVTGGGSDPYFFVRNLLHELVSVQYEMEIHTFANYFLPEYSSLNVIQHSPGLQLDRVAKDAGLAITTASTTSLEFIAREIPTLIACVTNNQIPNYRELVNLGYALPIGSRDEYGFWAFNSKTLESAITEPRVRDVLRKRIRGLIDLGATTRVMNEVEQYLLKRNLR